MVILFLVFTSCENQNQKNINETNTNNSKKTHEDLSDISTKEFRTFEVLDSKYITKEELWKTLNPQINNFKQSDHDRLKSLILEKDILTIQNSIKNKKLTYTELTKFFLYRIKAFDRENEKSLNSVISLNPSAIKQAQLLDSIYSLNSSDNHPIFGMPLLLKDNINTSDMPTTAGAVALKDNQTEDAFIVSQLKSKGAIILGKANLSEWAYFFCGDCPSGYSAIGGQTLNPYGRKIFDTGGSSSGSGVSVTANFCVAAIGSETSGSILSPSSKNAVVGLKPTVGLVSRSGIIPISSTLDTAGPMTKFVVDNAILLDAITENDSNDFKALSQPNHIGNYFSNLGKSDIEGIRLGAPKSLLEDSLFVNAIQILKAKGAEIIEIEEEDIPLPNFLNLLNLDMKADLPKYLNNYGYPSLEVKSIEDIISFNKKDSAMVMPYGQKLFYGIVNDKGDDNFLNKIKDTLKTNGRKFFNIPFEKYQLDGFLSINNYHASYAAVAEYPALTLPMGFAKEGEPKGLTFIAKSLKEDKLLSWAYVFEKASQARKMPKEYH